MDNPRGVIAKLSAMIGFAGACGLAGYVVGFRSAQPVCDGFAQIGVLVVAMGVIGLAVFIALAFSRRGRWR